MFSDWTLVCWIISDVLEKLTVRLMNNENDWEFKNFVFWVWTCLFLHLKLNLLRVNTTDSQFPRLPAELRITVWTVAPPLSGPAANHRGEFGGSSQSHYEEHLHRCFQLMRLIGFTAEWAGPKWLQVKHDFCHLDSYSGCFTLIYEFVNKYKFINKSGLALLNHRQLKIQTN